MSRSGRMVGGYVGVKVFLHYGYMNAVFVDLFIYLSFFNFFFFTQFGFIPKVQVTCETMWEL